MDGARPGIGLVLPPETLLRGARDVDAMKLTMVVFLAGASLVCGCSSVTTPYPLGERGLQIVASEWDGTWLSADGEVMDFNVVDASKGLIEAHWLEKESGTLVHQRFLARLRESNGWVFGSIPEGDTDDAIEPSDYVWARVLKNGEQLMLWTPEVGKFKRLVQEGRLPGTASGNVALGTLDSSHYQLITSESEGGIGGGTVSLGRAASASAHPTVAICVRSITGARYCFPALLPVKRSPLARVVADLVHRASVVEPTVHHHLDYGSGVSQVL